MEVSNNIWSSPLDGPTGKLHAGHLGRVSYGEVIRWNVSRKWHTPELKEWWYSKFTMSRRKRLVKLFNRQNGLCVFCGCQTWLAVEGVKKQKPPSGKKLKQMATVDHKIPQSQGGTDRMSNLAMACSLCNNDRQTTPFEEFLEVRSDPQKWYERNKKLNDHYQANAVVRKEKSAERAHALMWKLALLFILRPELIEISKTLPNRRHRRK
jgi:5-methylcytosine-specific restriction endonuclease McrA